MLELQQKFIKIEQGGEFKIDEYHDSEDDSELAIRLFDMAHQE